MSQLVNFLAPIAHNQEFTTHDFEVTDADVSCYSGEVTVAPCEAVVIVEAGEEFAVEMDVNDLLAKTADQLGVAAIQEFLEARDVLLMQDKGYVEDTLIQLCKDSSSFLSTINDLIIAYGNHCGDRRLAKDS